MVGAEGKPQPREPDERKKPPRERPGDREKKDGERDR
jgi:hypothetical protein